MLAPLSNYWGAWPPLAPPSSYAYARSISFIPSKWGSVFLRPLEGFFILRSNLEVTAKVVFRCKMAKMWRCTQALKSYPSPKVIKRISCSTQLSMKNFLLIYVKMPTIVGISTFTSRKNSIICLSEPENAEFLDIFILRSI